MAIYLLGTLTLLVTVASLLLLFTLSYKKGHPYRLWFLGGFLYNCFTISFFYVFLPVSWIESIFLQYLGITFFILGGSAVSGLSFLLIPFVLRRLHVLPKILSPFIILIAFIFQDIVRSLLVSLFLYGEGTSIGLHFILGSIGESLAFTPLVIFAYVGGTYFLTGVLALSLFLLFAYYKKILSSKIILLYFIFLTIIFFSLLVRETLPLPDLRIGILTTDSPDPDKERPAEELIGRAISINNLLKKEGGPELDLLILPESTSYLDARSLIEEEVSLPIKNYLDNTTIPNLGNYYTASLFYNKESDITEMRRKDGLMVFSEYRPYLYEVLSFFTKSEGTSDRRSYKRSYDYHTFAIGDVTFGALICSEGTSMMPLLRFEEKRPDFYTLQSNLVTMHKNPLGFMHLYAYTRLLAVTSGKPVLGVSNGAPSYGFDGKGSPLYSLKPSLSLVNLVLP
jgi:apolipoprotein N-acyltransferase